MNPISGGGSLERNFVLQQGFAEPSAASCRLQYSALLFQPKIVGFIVLAAVVLQAPAVFFALGGVLWWNALFPRWNPFDAFYNRLLASRPGGLALPAAPAPRRFAQGMAGTFALSVGVALLRRWSTAAILLEVLLILAVAALVFGGFCLGSFVFHLLRGRLDFARRTLPWARRA